MSDELWILQHRIERLEAGVGEIRNRLAHCIQAANHPPDAIALARGVAESLAKRMLENIGIKPPSMLDACLRELEKPEVMSRGLVPSEIITMLHMLRVMGNKATHDAMRIRSTAGDVSLVLQSLLRVVEWYFVEFERGPKLNPLFCEFTRTDVQRPPKRAELQFSVLSTTSPPLHLVVPHRWIRLGRDPSSDVVIADAEVSARHAVIAPLPSGILLVDRESKNGTSMGGRRINQSFIEHGSLIRIGSTTLACRLKAPAPVGNIHALGSKPTIASGDTATGRSREDQSELAAAILSLRLNGKLTITSNARPLLYRARDEMKL